MKWVIQYIVACLVFTLVLGFCIDASQNILDRKEARESTASISDSLVNTIQLANSFGPKRNRQVSALEIQGKAAVSMESNLVDPDILLFSKDQNTKLPIASLTKLMTAMVIVDNYIDTDIVEVNQIAAMQSPMQKDIQAGEKRSVRELLGIMLLGSSNRAAYALAEKMGEQRFVALMNEKAAELRLENTHFEDPTGLSENNVSTPADLARLSIAIIKNYPTIVSITELESIAVPGLGTISNTNTLLSQLPGVVIGKTGFTLDAKGCLLLVVYHPESQHYLVNVLLGSDDRFTEMQQMLNWVNTAYTW